MFYNCDLSWLGFSLRVLQEAADTSVPLSEVLSFIQPIVLEGNIKQNFIPENNRLYFVVTLKDDEHVTLTHAIVNIPSEKLPRFFVLTPQNGFEYVIFIDDIVRENVPRL